MSDPLAYTIRETIPPASKSLPYGFQIIGPGFNAGVDLFSMDPSFGTAVCYALDGAYRAAAGLPAFDLQAREALARAYRAGLEAACLTTQ